MYHEKIKNNRDATVKIQRFFLIAICLSFFSASVFAKTTVSGFMTPHDLTSNDAASNIFLHNNRASAVTAYGLYVRAFSSVLPGQSCDNATPIFPDPPHIAPNINVGAFLSPVTIGAGKSVVIGANFLYNMILQANYYATVYAPHVCSLPGCTWGDDSTIYNWCIYLGALAPVATTADYTSNIPPSGEAASSAGQYDYNLIQDYVTLGPISCNDQTMTCTVANQQTQPF